MLDFNKIEIGQVERVIEIAQSSGLSVLFIGNTAARLSAEKARKKGLSARWEKPCPCGNFNDIEKECRCKQSEIRQQQLKIKNDGAYIKLTVDRLMFKHVEPQLEKILDAESLNLLQSASNHWQFDFNDLNRTLKVARAIAKLDKHENIKARHIAEALQYQMQGGEKKVISYKIKPDLVKINERW